MAHPYTFTGLYKTSKHDARFHLYRLRESLEVGWTWMTESEIDRLLAQWKSSFLGCDYQINKKNSIHFSQFLLEQLGSDPELKHLHAIKLLRLPPCETFIHSLSVCSLMEILLDVDRIRRWTESLDVLRVFDKERDIAELNILYFLYMKFEGNLLEICRVTQCQTVEKVNAFEAVRSNVSPTFFSSIDLFN